MMVEQVTAVPHASSRGPRRSRQESRFRAFGGRRAAALLAAGVLLLSGCASAERSAAEVAASPAAAVGSSGAASSPAAGTSSECVRGGPCHVGDVGPGGGVIFYDAGSRQDWGQYLEVAPLRWSPLGNQELTAHWCDDPGGVPSSLARGNGPGSGRANSMAIAKECTSGFVAASYALDYRGGGRNDWYLPSLDEVRTLCEQRAVIRDLRAAKFLSSTNATSDAPLKAYACWITGGETKYTVVLADESTAFRPIRAF